MCVEMANLADLYKKNWGGVGGLSHFRMDDWLAGWLAGPFNAVRQPRRQAHNLDPGIICLDEGRQRLSRCPMMKCHPVIVPRSIHNLYEEGWRAGEGESRQGEK